MIFLLFLFGKIKDELSLSLINMFKIDSVTNVLNSLIQWQSGFPEESRSDIKLLGTQTSKQRNHTQILKISLVSDHGRASFRYNLADTRYDTLAAVCFNMSPHDTGC